MVHTSDSRQVAPNSLRPLAIAIALWGAVLSAAQGPPPRSFNVNPGARLHSALVTLAAASKTPIGFEADGVGSPQVSLTRSVDLSGMPSDKALTLLLGSKSSYGWVRENGAIVVRPVDPTTGSPRASFLDTRVDLDAQNVTLPELADRLRRTFLKLVPSRPVQPPPTWTRRISVPGKGTLAHVLTSAIVAHGNVTWAVTYEQIDLGDTPSVTITFATFEYSSFGMEMARPGSRISK